MGFSCWSNKEAENAITGLIVLPFKTAIATGAGNVAPPCAASSPWRSLHKEFAKREDHVLRPFAVLVLVVVTSSGSPAAAQDSWPSKPITVIVPFGAGGNTDSLARIYSARLSARLGQQFVIENRVGAGSIIGITSLAKAAPAFNCPWAASRLDQ
jgi:hypothetical protein